jgi:hypothetical protein
MLVRVLGAQKQSILEIQNPFHAHLYHATLHSRCLKNQRGFAKSAKSKTRKSELEIPKIEKWSILGIATAISGKRQEMDSAIACPTPESLGTNSNIYTFIKETSQSREPAPHLSATRIELREFTILQTIRAYKTIWRPAYFARSLKVCEFPISCSSPCPLSVYALGCQLTQSRRYPLIQAIRVRQDSRLPRHTTSQQGPRSMSLPVFSYLLPQHSNTRVSLMNTSLLYVIGSIYASYIGDCELTLTSAVSHTEAPWREIDRYP